MRLALKLLSSLAFLTVVFLGLSAVVEHRRQGQLLAMDIEASESMAERTAYVTQAHVQTAALGFVVIGLSPGCASPPSRPATPAHGSSNRTCGS